MNRKQRADQEATDGARRPRRRIAKNLLERGQRLRSRAGVIIGVSLSVVVLVSALE